MCNPDLQSGADERSDRTLDYKCALELQARLEAMERALSLALRVTMIDLYGWYEGGSTQRADGERLPLPRSATGIWEDLGDPNGAYYRLAHLARLFNEIGEAYGVDCRTARLRAIRSPSRNVLRELIASSDVPPALLSGEQS